MLLYIYICLLFPWKGGVQALHRVDLIQRDSRDCHQQHGHDIQHGAYRDHIELPERPAESVGFKTTHISCTLVWTYMKIRFWLHPWTKSINPHPFSHTIRKHKKHNKKTANAAKLEEQSQFLRVETSTFNRPSHSTIFRQTKHEKLPAIIRWF